MSKRKPLTEKQLKQKLQKFIPALKSAGKPIASAALCAFLTLGVTEAAAQRSNLADKDPTHTTSTTATKPGNPPKTIGVKFVVDTFDVNKKGAPTAYARTSPSNGYITVYYVPGDILFNEQAQSIDRLVHEGGHLEHFLKGAYDYPVSPEQALKRNRHEEISVNMRVLIYKRAEYLKTGDLDVFNGFFSYYRKAIEDGTIVPDSKDIEEFDKEMKFILDETEQNWLKIKGDIYKDQDFNQVNEFGDMSGKYARFHDINYLNSVNEIYTICGINFWKYRTKDLEISAADQKKLTIMESKTPKEPPSSTNDPIHRSRISREAKYPVHTSEHRVSKPITVYIDNYIIQTPPGHPQATPIVREETQQKAKENVTQNIQKKKHEKKTSNTKSEGFWQKVKDFFKPTPYTNPYKQSSTQQPAPKTTPSQTTAKPAPTGQTSKPAPSTIVTKTVQNTPSMNAQKTISQQDQTTSRISPIKKKTAKIKLNKLRTIKNKQTAPSSGYISPRDKRDMKAMKKNVAKYAKVKSANNN